MAKKITAISVYTKDGGWSTPYPIGSTTVKEASATIAGILKAYTSTGSNTDGTMTQAAITQALSSIDALETKTDNMKASFQAGVDGIYNAITAQGTTPASKSQSDVQAAIPTLANNSYNKGSADGYNKGSADGYNKGVADGRNDSPIHVRYVRSWEAGSSAGEINIRIIVTKNGRQVYDTGNFRPWNTESKEFDC